MSRIPRPFFVALAFVSLCQPVASGQTPSAPPYRVGGEIRPPSKIKDVAPVYPVEAQRARVSGVVILEATIGEDGKVRDTRVLRSIPMLDQAAVDAVRQWQYTPTLINGVAVPIIMTVTVNFGLQSPSGAPVPPTIGTPQGMLRLLSSRGEGGRVWVWDIEPARATKLPKWNGEAEPPLSMTNATRIARSWLAARNPPTAGFTLQGVTLLRRVVPGGGDFWWYQATYTPAAVAPGLTQALMVIVLLDGSVLEPTELGVTPVPQPTPQVTPIPPGVVPPRAVREVRPSYTPEALRQKITGSVVIEGVVGIDGSFSNLRIVRSLDAVYGLDAAALEAARQWQFIPGTRDGQPVPVVTTVELSFSVR